jgi:hypothetical protein
MQDRYVGDVGDFGKYGLLRRLCNSSDDLSVRLGVVWCRFPDERHNEDGKHISYLRMRDFVGLDPGLLSALCELVNSNARSIESLTAAGILPPQTTFYDAFLAPPASQMLSRSERLRHRSAWVDGCFTLMADCDLVFFDPDNGIEVSSIAKHHPLAGKYIYWDELARFWDRGQTLLVYQHLNRTKSAAGQIDGLRARIRATLRGSSVRPLVFRRGSCRVFWLVHHNDNLGHTLEDRARDMLRDRWSKHFRPFGWPNDDQVEVGTR